MTALALILLLTLGLLVAPRAVEAQQPGKVYRIGMLRPGPPTVNPHVLEAFRHGLREQGWVEGQNLLIEYRFGQGLYESLPGLAAELVRLPVEVMVTTSTPAALAAKAATSTIPIVFIAAADPVGSGLIATWGQPGGNITGVGGDVDVNTGKTFELLKEVVPAATRVAVLGNPNNPFYGAALQKLQAAAQLLRLDLHVMEVRDPASDLERAFAALAHERVDALCMLPEPALEPYRTRIVELVAARRLPAIYGVRSFVEAGGLMYYASDLAAQARSASVMVDKILRGTKPAEIPAEYPMKFTLTLNLKTAKALGLTIPPHILALADEVIR